MALSTSDISDESGLHIDDESGLQIVEDEDNDVGADSLFCTLQSPSAFPSFHSQDSEIQDSDPFCNDYAYLDVLHQHKQVSCRPSLSFGDPEDVTKDDVLCDESSTLNSHFIELGGCNSIDGELLKSRFLTLSNESQSAVDPLIADALDEDSPEETLAPDDDGNVQHFLATDDVPCDGAVDPSVQSSSLSPHRYLEPLRVLPSPTGNASLFRNCIGLTGHHGNPASQHGNSTEVRNHGILLQCNHPRFLQTGPSPAAVKSPIKNASAMVRKTSQIYDKENLASGEERQKRVAEGSWICPRDSKRNFKAKPHQALIDKWLVKRR